jgi:hypothetical protein
LIWLAALADLRGILEGAVARAFEDLVGKIAGCVPGELDAPEVQLEVDQVEYDAAINDLLLIRLFQEATGLAVVVNSQMVARPGRMHQVSPRI